MEHERMWLVDSLNLEEDAWHKVLQPFTLLPEQQRQHHYQLLDTFDWGLWRQGMVLLQDRSSELALSYALWKKSDFLSGTALEIKREGQEPARFWWDFSAAEERSLQQQLKSACKLRTLLEMHSFDQSRTRYAVKNSDQKSVAWLEHVVLHTNADPEGNRGILRLLAVRGYDRELKILQKRVQGEPKEYRCQTG